MHVAIPSIGLLGTNGIVGGGIPIATGAAYGMQAQARDDVTICFFGEGAAAAGVFAEALNLAALWQLPLIFICENNQYVELTPQELHVAGRSVPARRAVRDPRRAGRRQRRHRGRHRGLHRRGARPRRRRPDADRGPHLSLVRTLCRRSRRLPLRGRGARVASARSAAALPRRDRRRAGRRDRGRSGAGDRRRARVRPQQPGHRSRFPVPRPLRTRHDHHHSRTHEVVEVLAGRQPGPDRGDGARRAGRARRRGRRPSRRPVTASPAACATASATCASATRRSPRR